MPDEEQVVETEEKKKDLNDFEGLDGEELHEALKAQADEEILAEKEGREPRRVLDKQETESEDEEENPDESEEQGDDDQGKDDDANEDDANKKDSESEDDESEAGEEGGDDLDKEITEHAEKEGITYAEAKEDLEKTKRIIEQYGNDAKKMAKAMREKDREYQKLRVEKEKADKKEPPFIRKSDNQFLHEVKEVLSNPNEADLDKDGNLPIISNFRQKWPARSENMSDEAIIEVIAEDALKQYQGMADKKEKEIETTANKKRDDFISSLPKEDRRFIPEIKAILSKTDAFTLADEDFSFQDVVDIIKGRSYDADIKAAEERGAKRGSEKPKIAGIQSAKGGSNNGGRNRNDASTGLSDKQKKRAVEMYGTNYEDKECYKMFKDTFADRLKENPNFV